MQEKTVKSVMKQLLLAINELHSKNIIHRDIKPSNMLVIPDPSLGELVKVLDFGIAKLVQSDSEQTTTTVVVVST